MSRKNKHKNQQTPPAHHNPGQHETTNSHVYIEPGTKIDFVQALRDKYDAAQQSSTTHSKKILFWTIVSAVLLFIYAGFTAWQAWETRLAVKTSREANKLTEDSIRARLAITGVHFVRPITAGQRIAIKLLFKYIGHTQAIYGVAAEAH